MATKQRKKPKPRRHIREDANGHRQYVLHPEDSDLFVRTGRQVIEGCRLGISVEVWLDECRAMFGRVLEWATARAGRVRACYAAPGIGGITLFFVPYGEAFDFDLADELSELNVELVRGFNVGPVDINQLPATELDRFLPPDASVRIYGDAARPRQPVET